MQTFYKKQKGISTPILILVVALVLIVVVAAVAIFYSDKPAPEIEPELDTSADLVPEETTDEEGDAVEETVKDGESADTENDEQVEEVDEEQEETSRPLTLSGKVLAGSSSPLVDFNQSDYQTALASDKLVVLYFYANWCPICKVEVSTATYPAFNEIEESDVVGFRVNFNDNQTDAFEKDLASEFGVAYQHTKVFIQNGERVLKSPESWSKTRYLEEFAVYTQ